MRIVVVEDDALQYEDLEDNLRREFPGVRLERIKTANELMKQIKRFRESRPDVVIIDVMIPWQLPNDPPHTPPARVAQSDFRHLGIHCQRWLAEDEQTCRLPVILYSELSRGTLGDELLNLPSHVHYLRKGNGYKNLNRLIRQAILRPSKEGLY